MPELMWRQPAPHPGCHRGVAQLDPDPGRGTRPSASRAAQHAEQRADRQARTELEPGIERLPCPTVHPDLTAPTALPVSDLDRAPDPVQIALGQRKRFADPQPSAPQHHDHAAEPDSVGVITSSAHDGDDLLDRRRVRWISKPLVARRSASVVPG
jgi:hypothetical protein